MSLQLDCSQGLLRLQGRLDAAGAQQLSAWLAAHPNPPPVWDLAGLSFLSSAGLRSLIALDRRVRAGGGRPQVVVATPVIADALAIAGLDRQWDTHPSPAAALAAAARDNGSRPRQSFQGAAGTVYAITPAPAPATGTLTRFRAAPGEPALLLRFEELGVALGRGGFTTGSDPDSRPGLCLATGRTLLVRDADGLTDYLATQDPARTFAAITEAVRLDTEGAERWETAGPVTWEHLCADLAGRAAGQGNPGSWAAGIAARMDGRAVTIAAVADPAQPLLALGASAPGEAAGCEGGSFADALVAMAGADSPELFVPGGSMLFSDVRVWFLPAPREVDGGTTRLAVESPEPLPAAWECIVRSTFREAARVRLRRLSGGFTASTFAAETTDRDGRRTLPTVLKISPRPVTAREEAAYHQYVRPFILNNATVLFDQAAHGDVAGLRYNFVGITGAESRLQPLEALYRGDRFQEALAALRQTLTNVLEPWYGQARVTPVHPFADHDPRGLFPTLPEAAHEGLGINPDQPLLPCPPLQRSLPNPYHLLHHRWDALRTHTESWAAGITHGDLNLNNILIDERRNLYVIDFSETRLRSVASDYARLEPIALLQWTRLAGPADADILLRVIEASLRGPVWSMPAPPAHAADPMLHRAVALVSELRALASRRVADPAHEAAYLMPLLEWTLPIVAFRQLDKDRKQLAAWAAGLMLEKLLRVLRLPAPA